jgi:spore coat protein CotF
MANQFTDKELMNVLLNEHKLQASSLNNLILESSSQQLRQDCINLLQDVYSHQKQIFDTMQQQGWYQVKQADQQEISRAQQQLQSGMMQ